MYMKLALALTVNRLYLHWVSNTCTCIECQTLALSVKHLHMHQDCMTLVIAPCSKYNLYWSLAWSAEQATSVWDVKFWIGTRQWGVINCDLLVMIILQKYPPTASSTVPPGITSRSQSQTQVNQNYLHSSWLIICRDVQSDDLKIAQSAFLIKEPSR